MFYATEEHYVRVLPPKYTYLAAHDAVETPSIKGSGAHVELKSPGTSLALGSLTYIWSRRHHLHGLLAHTLSPVRSVRI